MDNVCWSEYSSGSFSSAMSNAEVAKKLNSLCAAIDEFMARRGFSHGNVMTIVNRLKELGHDLYSFDEDDDFELWSNNYVGAKVNLGLTLHLYREGRSRAAWWTKDGKMIET